MIQALPEFGPYLNEKESKIAAYKKSIDPATEFQPEVHRPAYKPSVEVPTIKVMCGSVVCYCGSVVCYCGSVVW